MNSSRSIKRIVTTRFSLITAILAGSLQLHPALGQPNSSMQSKEHVLSARLVETTPVALLNEAYPLDLDDTENYSDEPVWGEQDDRIAHTFITKGGSQFDEYHAGIIAKTEIHITTGAHANAGTEAKIIFYIGDHPVSLEGAYDPNMLYVWKLNADDNDFYQQIHPDDWDHLSLYTDSEDGLHIAHIKIYHNNYRILDTDVDAWLDKHYGRKMIFDHEVAMTKWAKLDYTRNPVLYFAAMDLGQSGSWKYVDEDVPWCSEFASWAIRNGTGLNTPEGNIWVGTMLDYFASIDRLYSKDDINSRKYDLKPGDYVSINDRGHSTLFVEWIKPFDLFRAIDGNWGNRVRIREVEWADVKSEDGIGSIYGVNY